MLIAALLLLAAPDWTKAHAGRWTLYGVSEGDPVCGITLGADEAIGGASVKVSATCRRNYPLEDVAAWSLGADRSIRLIDPLRKVVLVLQRAPDGPYMSQFADGRMVSFERGPPDKPASWRALVADEGTFTLSGPNNSGACGFALTASGGLEQAGRCPAPWKSRGWKGWALKGDALSLNDAKGRAILTLQRADEYTFEGKGATGPVFFGPGVIDGSEMLERR